MTIPGAGDVLGAARSLVLSPPAAAVTDRLVAVPIATATFESGSVREREPGVLLYLHDTEAEPEEFPGGRLASGNLLTTTSFAVTPL